MGSGRATVVDSLLREKGGAIKGKKCLPIALSIGS